ncbi:MAG: nucleotidyltransferase family protein [Woeseiaceae bacterium]
MIAMVLAAGRGERLRPITDTVPKALVDVGGVSLLERHLGMLQGAGVSTVVINLGWLGEKIVERIGSGRAYGLHVVYSPEYDNVLETGGGNLRALPQLGSDLFWVVNADVFSDYRIDQDSIPDDCLAHLVLVPTPAHKSKGDFDLVAGKVRNAEYPLLTFSGIGCYRAEFFAGPETGRFSLAPLLHRAADAGRLSGSRFDGKWHDVGTPERLDELNRELAHHGASAS